jgi:lipopolysaccharide export system protein LptA
MLEVETEASFGNKTPTTIAKRQEQMNIRVLFALSTVLAGVLSGAGICTVYAQGGQVREIGLAPASKSSDTAVQTSSVVLPFPISITEPGNYRLNTNLSGGGRGAISIESSDVTLDLNGFSATATGNVIVANGFNIAILNGTISGGEEAIIAGSNCRVEKLRIAGGADGMSLGTNCIVKDNTVQAAHTGIVCSGCVVSGNTVSTISDVAIGVANSSLVVGNTATSTGNIALFADDTTGYAQNVLHGNQADVSGGVQIGQNLCVTSKICPP